VPGPTGLALSRSVAVRGALAALAVIALVAVVGVAVITFRGAENQSAPPSEAANVRAANLQALPAPGQTGAATCTDPVAQEQWRVTWRAGTASPVILIPTGFAVRPLPNAHPTSRPTAGTATPETTATSTGATLPGGWQSRDADRWLLRWSPTPAETATAVPNEEWVRMGPLPTLAAIAMTVRQDPRFVTPDGSCTVYLAPFGSGTASTRHAVAVVGDSLVVQVFRSEDGTETGPGWLISRLTRAGAQAEIAGQDGRRWTIKPDIGSHLEEAEASMFDEIRGLREARSVVIALGTNDAGWVALAPDQEQYELRLAWVLLHLVPILDELRDHGHCTVLATMATRNKTYINTAPGRFDAVATRINDYLRQRAGTQADPHDRLRLWDWAAQADWHGTTDPQPWFDTDTIHLNPAGHAAYADGLASAATLC
jgi:lysophospholipase L1-like esterase